MRYILSIGHDPMLLETRRLLLDSLDFRTDNAQDVPTGISLCQQSGTPIVYCVVILCHTLELEEIDAFCAYLHDTGSHSRVLRLRKLEDISYYPQKFVALVQEAAEVRAAGRAA
jgi:hypothetical protein